MGISEKPARFPQVSSPHGKSMGALTKKLKHHGPPMEWESHGSHLFFSVEWDDQPQRGYDGDGDKARVVDNCDQCGYIYIYIIIQYVKINDGDRSATV